jgi:hypothetical protein
MVDRWVRRLVRRPTGPRIYLHIGAMKTGTTFLQEIMSANRQALREAGFLFPGSRWTEQSSAVRDILFDPADPRMRAKVAGTWDKLRDRMLSFPGQASIVSMEFLSFADAEQARRVVESLSGAEVHIVLTVRDAAAAIPAQWQTSCRNGGRISYQRLVRAVRYILNDELPPRARSARLFRRTQGIPDMLDVWVPLVGARRVHIVTVPPRGADPLVLWRRFAKVVGVDPEVCSVPPTTANPSLGHASSELLRRVNAKLGPVHRLDYNKVVKGKLARVILSQRADVEAPMRLNQRGMKLATRWNLTVREAIAAHGVRVVGTLDDLPISVPVSGVPRDLPRPTPADLLASATTARDGLAALVAELSTKVGDPVPAPPPDLPTPADRWDDTDDPVDAAVTEVTDLVRTCVALQHRLSAG